MKPMKRMTTRRYPSLVATVGWVVVLVAVASSVSFGFFGGSVGLAKLQEPPQRIVSLIPAVTETLFAIGAGPQVVGIGSFDELPVGADTEIARIGALMDPDTERMLTLRPDLVFLYASQVDPREQLERAGISVVTYRHGGLGDVISMIRMIGQRAGRGPQGEALATRLESGLEAVSARLAGRQRPRTLLVFAREPAALRGVYATGGRGFLHDMLTMAGGDNVFADVGGENVAQVSSEAILTAAPDVVIEIRNEGTFGADTLAVERAVWERLSTLPAVRTGRVNFLSGGQFVVPGPRVLEAVKQLARLLHPEAF